LDDEESIRSLLEEGLAARGLQVSCCSTAEEAASLIAQRPFDALICDLRLKSGSPFSDGRAAAAHVLAAAHDPKPLLIYMTGEYVDPNAQIAPGSAAHLQKPFRIADVLAILREALVVANPRL
jgi:DNA-binding NtrC family response regulator